MPKKEEYCEECGEHVDDCECEEYCEECDNPIDECECDNDTTLQDVGDVIDTANKGLDFLDRLKKYSEPAKTQTHGDEKSKVAAQASKQEKQRGEKFDKKWKIETIVKIAIPIIVALIGVSFFLK